MDLAGLLSLAESSPAYGGLVSAPKRRRGETPVAVIEAAKPYLIAALYRDLRRPILVVTAQPENAKKLQEQVMAWYPDSGVRLFPEPDALPYQRVVADLSTETERLQVLAALVGLNGLGEAPLVITSAPAIMMKTTPHRAFASACHTVKTSVSIPPLELLQRWEAMGYRMESVVEVPGTMSRRGGIVDIYPPTSEIPARLDFLGNTIESIRLFDPTSQRSLRDLFAIAITPATEVLTPFLSDRDELVAVIDRIDLSGVTEEMRAQLREELTMLLDKQRPHNLPFYAPLFNTDSLLDYLPEGALLIVDGPQGLRQAMETLDAEASELRIQKTDAGELPASFPVPYFTWDELFAGMAKRPSLSFTSWESEETESLRLDFTQAPSYGGQLEMLVRKARQLLDQQKRLIIVSHQASRLTELLNEADILAPPVTEIKQAPLPGSITLVQGSLAEGWVMKGQTYLLTDAEIFGFVKQRRLARRRPVAHYRLLADISPGDYVVHIEHGIGKFAGVTTMSRDSTQREYLVLLYAAGDKLYVPTDQIDRVGRYVGAGDQPPTLSRLGTQEWSKTKQKVKEAAADIAQDLLALYATRELTPGFKFSRDTVWQQELEASFPYVETPDQMTVQAQVKADMEKPRPMDRLVCGDVGYGKTEIALRAAFKAMTDGKQVAVLVPTTVLAQQHFNTFRERLNAFPVRVEVLSRFRTPKEQQAVVDGLVKGSVDVVIGTHRLLQKDVVFKDLGLLIIDEEQRFGVAHKEFLKKLRQEVDVLTLSATPIPRTLHMSLVGVRDMSTIETPPEDRLPIKTYVAEYNDRLVREAILRELERNGQVFFVHNRVQSIAWIASRLKELVPEAKIAVGHGQMPEAQLERVMTDFIQGKADVLVSTTIIESGLDMPNVNTLIVNNADKLGLTQLYQLRGRIGRGTNLAYAYFLYEKDKRLTATAEKRLKTIFEATELGAGFSIAMKDLEIRGAGTLLGTRQSGQISAVGFSLYCRLLAEAVEDQKARRTGAPAPKPLRLPEPTLDLPLRAYIPEDYVDDLTTRLGIYQRLAAVKEPEKVADFLQELTDRFGVPPTSVKNLLYAVKIKLLAAKAGIESITTEDGQIVLRQFEGRPFDRNKLAPFLKDGLTLGQTQLRLSPKRLGTRWQGVLEEVVGRVGN